MAVLLAGRKPDVTQIVYGIKARSTEEIMAKMPRQQLLRQKWTADLAIRSLIAPYAGFFSSTTLWRIWSA